MITLSVGHLNNDMFWGSLEALEKQKLPIATALKLVKLKKKLLEESKDHSQVYKGILEEFCGLDEQGRIKSEVVEDQGLKKPKPILREDANKDDYLTKLTEFFKQEITIDFDKFEIEDFKDVIVPAKALYLLEPILNV